MRYIVYTTVNRANGTEYDMDVRTYENKIELNHGLGSIVSTAEVISQNEADLAPSSIIITVVPA